MKFMLGIMSNDFKDKVIIEEIVIYVIDGSTRKGLPSFLHLSINFW